VAWLKEQRYSLMDSIDMVRYNLAEKMMGHDEFYTGLSQGSGTEVSNN
jgi:hypothetical protein